jgi:adenylate cyclase
MPIVKLLQKKRGHSVFIISILIVILFSALHTNHVFEEWNFKVTDALYSQGNALDNIVIVGIDEKSLSEIGRWPWSRSNLSNLIGKLQGASAIGVDIALIEDESLDVDSELRDVIGDSGRVILASKYIDFRDESGRIKATLQRPLESLKSESGFVNVFSSNDGVTRFAPLIIDQEKSFAIKIIEKAFGKVSIPQDSIRVNYVGSPGTFEIISFSDVIDESKNFDFNNKIVLVGAIAKDLHDSYFVPTSQGQAMSGVEIHANIIQSILTKSFLEDQGAFSVILVMLLFSLLIAFSSIYLRLRWTHLISLGLIIGYVIAAIFVFESGLVLNLIYPIFAVIFSYVAIISYLYFFEGREKKKAMGAFKQYVSPDVIKELLKHPEKLKLGGARKNVTIFFSDVRGFTTISEKLTPEQLVHFLNIYLTHMSDIILDNKGVIDKYIGDAIMAFWGAPIETKRHAHLACDTSLKMMERLRKMQIEFEKEGLPHIDIGIGLNSGDCVIGNMGSTKRFDYTAMGDTVNLAARLEGLTKQYGVKILIGEKTYDKIEKAFVCREIDFVQVKGKNEGVTIYELVCRKSKVSSQQLSYIKTYERGFHYYKKKKFKEAIVEFEKCLNIKDDLAAKAFIKRCREYIKNSPAKNWNGIYEWKSK